MAVIMANSSLSYTKMALPYIMRQFLEEVVTLVTDENGIILHISEDYAKIIGLSRDEAEGAYCYDVIPRSRMHIVARTGKKELGVPFLMKNGEYVIIDRLPVHENGAIKAVVCIILFSTEVLTTQKSVYILDNITQELQQYKTDLKKLRGSKYSIENIIGTSPPMTAIKQSLYKVSQTKSTILIRGETGTGKELFAHAIHSLSPRSHQPLVTINCAAIPADLFESELFGYVEGAFTGARRGGSAGKFELANKGTLVLDEIHLLPLQMQPKLLRVLQEREIERVGGGKTIGIDVRMIFITNQNLLELVERGLFREDLFYRINIVPIKIPPLRERKSDIEELTEHLIGKINRNLGLRITGIDPEAIRLFGLHDWPGNVRELEHVLERAANICLSGQLTLDCFESILDRVYGAELERINAPETLHTAKMCAERSKIVEALASSGGNVSKACKGLNISRSTIYEKMKKYAIDAASCR